MRKLVLTAVSLVALLLATAAPALAQAPFSTPPSEAQVCAFAAEKGAPLTGCVPDPLL